VNQVKNFLWDSRRTTNSFVWGYGALFLFLVLASSRVQATTCDLTLNSEQLQNVSTYESYTWSDSFKPWSVSESLSASNFVYSEILNWNQDTNPLGIHLLDLQASNSYIFNFGTVQTTPFALADKQIKLSGVSSGSSNVSHAAADYSLSSLGPPDMIIPEATTIGMLVCAIPFLRMTLRKRI
jgi:hypothetical protein